MAKLEVALVRFGPIDAALDQKEAPGAEYRGPVGANTVLRMIASNP